MTIIELGVRYALALASGLALAAIAPTVGEYLRLAIGV